MMKKIEISLGDLLYPEKSVPFLKYTLPGKV